MLRLKMRIAILYLKNLLLIHILAICVVNLELFQVQNSLELIFTSMGSLHAFKKHLSNCL